MHYFMDWLQSLDITYTNLLVNCDLPFYTIEIDPVHCLEIINKINKYSAIIYGDKEIAISTVMYNNNIIYFNYLILIGFFNSLNTSINFNYRKSLIDVIPSYYGTRV